ncbi:hypothetical protein RclHR1_11760003 [Rhizophagus clarus]|uniref:Uncharacterized protein n=1 Tax=Rhizophagus clarus TaxID=94130 RepID=A0A2Z6QHG2_9GLOM|nr:hypothetical protein RclHR1_11760003 [Rhizophagus clarus]GET04418.1 hypothetical protein GLOIN_2v1584707 [Rhizophagus clarus]
MIRHSFKYCGISNATNGTKDNLIFDFDQLESRISRKDPGREVEGERNENDTEDSNESDSNYDESESEESNESEIDINESESEDSNESESENSNKSEFKENYYKENKEQTVF